MSTFRDVFVEARARILRGDDPELVVPPVLAAAEAEEEIEMAESLYGDDPAPEQEQR
ncbi:MAG TPA: hypothetical protein VMU66_04690 [Gaiellales bacterium]|nr:hypothetical protein [Gaiellales bacterium]